MGSVSWHFFYKKPCLTVPHQTLPYHTIPYQATPSPTAPDHSMPSPVCDTKLNVTLIIN